MVPVFAKDTQVSVTKSRFELDALLQKYGASSICIGQDDARGLALVAFHLDGAPYSLALAMPTLAYPGPTPDHWCLLSVANRRTFLEQATKARWRSLVLLVKAKLEAIRIGLTTTRQEFATLPEGPSTSLARAG